jgi:uncharacterized protein YndB with AHSA1/START domain
MATDRLPLPMMPPERVVRRELVLRARPEEVWMALTSPARLAEWFGAKVELEPRRGGSVEARWRDGATRRGVVEIAEHARRLAFRWRPIERTDGSFRVGSVTRVEFLIEATEVGTRLTVIEGPGILPSEGPLEASA